MLGERTVSQRSQRHKQAADAFRIHDERSHVVLGIGIGLEVRHVIARPLAGAVSFHQTCLRVGSQGLPSRSQEARLYRTRRFAGHDHPQFWWIPRPDGSSGLRRCVAEPASGQEPQYSQLPQDVVPSSFSQAKPGSCCPVFQSVGVCLSSWRSASALPLISLATSVSEGLFGIGVRPEALRIASGNLPPSFW